MSRPTTNVRRWPDPVFDREFFSKLAGAGSSSRRPVFVLGLPRSGTTLIEQVLASHSRIHGAGEAAPGSPIIRRDSAPPRPEPAGSRLYPAGSMRPWFAAWPTSISIASP